ncbi:MULTISPECIES: DUF1289 domain-containing protein [Pseudomonas]|uniref:DUF1289 domain-containing protein n=1 Tax=Pseudomonas piscis TaxID=2614538 RepID=A0A7X1PK71_9PSED|nr:MULTISPECIES: DUF1289 domain-containing protein [Pseudomonas]AZC19069.1 hypothetical protein C4K40_3682 [Pseudomonas sp. CMR5c]MCU7647061.1 DUF1289 domain-containing protein [Pseudomonas piscis]MQA53676.1 DUF1289 domain-containing protein [Pseudomonas piscis]
MLFEKIKTPCIGLCSTVYGDVVCRGCKRFEYEVIQWNTYDEPQKQAILRRFDKLLNQVMHDKCEIFDPERLAFEVRSRKMNCSAEDSIPYCAYQIIRRGAAVISNIEAFGIRVLPAYQGLSLVELRDVIDSEFFALSLASYQAGG